MDPAEHNGRGRGPDNGKCEPGSPRGKSPDSRVRQCRSDRCLPAAAGRCGCACCHRSAPTGERVSGARVKDSSDGHPDPDRAHDTRGRRGHKRNRG